MKREETVTSELIDAITQSEKYVIPEPIKTKLGYHIILLCENRDKVEKEKPQAPLKPKAAPAGTNIPTQGNVNQFRATNRFYNFCLS